MKACWKSRLLPGLVISTICFACASGPGTASESSPAALAQAVAGDAPEQERGDYREIQTLYAGAAYEASILRAAKFEKTYPNSALLPLIHNLHGLNFLLTKRPLQAINQFKKAAELSQANPGFRQHVLYNRAAAEFELNQLDDAQQTLAGIQPESLDKETRVKFHFLRAKLFTKRGLTLEATREALAASRFLDAAQARGPFIVQTEAALQNLTDTPSLDVLFHEYEDSPLADLVLYRLGAQEITQGRRDAGEAHLRLLMTRYPQTVHYSDATDLLRSVQNQGVVDGAAVGVLLPMKGKYARFGLKSLQGIELAFRIFNVDEPDSRVTLVIEDSGEDAESAVKALNSLFFKHHVIAVLGPLLSKGIDPVTQRAQELGVPLLNLAQQTGAAAGDYVFSTAMTPKLQAYEVARYAIERMGMHKFAILHPRDKFGEQYSQHYWDAVESLGGKIVGIESYSPGETDFRQPIDKLSGLYYTEARARELEALAKERELNNIRKRTRKTEQFFSLKPVVDYEAVFIPDEPKVIGQILPTFAYRDVDKVRFLGISSWDSPEFLTRAQSYAEGSIFVDAFFPESAAPGVKKFMTRYRTTFSQEPTAMEAMAFDAASILDQALVASTGKTRMEIRDKLKAVAGFSGVTGKITYRDGQLLRDLDVLTVRGGKIAEAK